MSIQFNLSKSLAFAMAILSQHASAFSIKASPLKKTTSHTGKMPLNAVQVNNSEDDAMGLLFRARDCADSESCSIDMANAYLKEVVHVQSGCAAGTLSGAAVCDNALLITEVVASLRSKIEKESYSASRQFLTARQAELEELTLTSMNPSDSGVTLSPVAAITSSPFRLFYLGVALFYLATLLSMLQPATPGVVPFTGQEWWWAARDGYLGDMVSESLKYGGFMTDNPGDMIASAFTGQEWWWAVRDGYVGDMVSENMKYGGLMSENVAESTALPFTSQEWWWAVRDGYVGNMISHAFKNGGL